MKKLILTAALTAATALSGFSQGQINFQNAITSTLGFNSTATTNRATSATIGSQTGTTSTGVVDVGLYWSTAAFTDAANGTLADMVGMSTATTAAGQLAGGTVVLPVASGTTVYVQVFAWDSTYATPDEDLAAKAYFGAWSAGAANTTYGAIGAAQLTTGLTVSPAPGTPIFGTGVGQYPKCVMLLGTTPEPATIAIGGLGAAALLLFRRRK